MKGIDVSKWQGAIDWNALKGKIDFAIIKAGGSDWGFYKDPFFEANYKGAKAAGIPVGAYYFVGNKFWGAESGKVDAQKFLSYLKGKEFELPVYLDVEAQNRARRRDVTEAAKAFCNYMESKKSFVGIYGSEYSTFDEMVYAEELTAYSWWVANYSRQPRKPHAVWQYSDTGRIFGIVGNVDMNSAQGNQLKPIMQAIKKKGLNKWT